MVETEPRILHCQCELDLPPLVKVDVKPDNALAIRCPACKSLWIKAQD